MVAAITGRGREGQPARAGRLTTGSLLNGVIVSVIAHVLGFQVASVGSQVPARSWATACSAVWPLSLAVPVTER